MKTYLFISGGGLVQCGRIGCPKKQKDILCFSGRSYPGWFLSPDSKDIKNFIRR